MDSSRPPEEVPASVPDADVDARDDQGDGAAVDPPSDLDESAVLEATEAAGPPPAGPDEPPEPPGEPDLLAAVRALGADLGARLDALQRAVERETRAEANREKVVDRLHAELQEYKQDLLLRMLRPIFLDLIQLHDDIGKSLEQPPGLTRSAAGDAGAEEPPPGPDTETIDRLLDLMRGFQQGIEDILYRQGVEPYTVEADAFDPRQQRAVTTVPADTPEQARTVAARIRRGFRAGDRVIRPELVQVFAPPPRST